MTIKELMTVDQDNMIKALPMIPKKSLDMLYSILHSNQGVNSKPECVQINPVNGQDNQKSDLKSQCQHVYNKHEKTSDDKGTLNISTMPTECLYFNQQKLKQPSLERNKRKVAEIKANFTADYPMPASNQMDSSIIKINTDYENKKFEAMDSFPDKRHAIHFGRRQMFQDDSSQKPVEYSQQDTQDTDDVLSLNDSQCSVQLNEFEKAEIAGTVNRITRIEMDEVEFPVPQNYSGNKNHQFGSVPDIELRYGDVKTCSNPKVLDTKNMNFWNSDPQSQQSDVSKNQASSQISQIKQWDKNIDISKSDLRCKQNNYVEAYRPDEQKICEPSVSSRQADSGIYDDSVENAWKADAYFKKSSVLDSAVRRSEKYEIEDTIPKDIKNTHSGRKNFESRSFARDLSETTRNILRQAYQSPRFGVRPMRPLSQRISVGLAQPLRRETNNKQTSDEDRMVQIPNRTSQASQNSSRIKYKGTPVQHIPLERFSRHGRQDNLYYDSNEKKSDHNVPENRRNEDRRQERELYVDNNLREQISFDGNSEKENWPTDRNQMYSNQSTSDILTSNEQLMSRNNVSHTDRQSHYPTEIVRPNGRCTTPLDSRIVAIESCECSDDSAAWDGNGRRQSELNRNHNHSKKLTPRTPHLINVGDLNRTEGISNMQMSEKNCELNVRDKKFSSPRTRMGDYLDTRNMNPISCDLKWQSTEMLSNTPCLSNDSRTSNTHRQWSNYDSPPMDLDYLDDLMGVQMYKEQNEDCREYFVNNTKDTTNKMFISNDRSIPNKRRKLAYARQPGSRNGQTKLVFK